MTLAKRLLSVADFAFIQLFLLPSLKVGNRNDASVFHAAETFITVHVVGKVEKRNVECRTCFAYAPQCQSVE